MAKPRQLTQRDMASLGSDGSDPKGGTTAVLDGAAPAAGLEPKPEHVQVKVFVNGAGAYNAKGPDGKSMSSYIPFPWMKNLAADQGPVSDEQIAEMYGVDATVPADLLDESGQATCFLCGEKFIPRRWPVIVKDKTTEKYLVVASMGNFVTRFESGKAVALAGCGSPVIFVHENGVQRVKVDTNACITILRSVSGKDDQGNPVYYVGADQKPKPLRGQTYQAAAEWAANLNAKADSFVSKLDRVSSLARPKGHQAGPGSSKIGGWPRKSHGGR